MANSMQQHCLGCLQNLYADAVVVQLAACGHHFLLCRRCCSARDVQVDRDRSDLHCDGTALGIAPGRPVNRYRCPECEQTFQVFINKAVMRSSSDALHVI